VLGHPSCAVEYPAYPGFTLTVAEEFEGPLDLDNDEIWTWSDGALDEGIVRYQKEGLTFQDGMMRITVSQQSIPGGFSYAEEKDVNAQNLLSGELRTKYNNFRYGRYEARWKAPSPNPANTSANGGYASTLFVFRNPKFQEWREIDIELVGNNGNQVTFNLVNMDNSFGWNPEFQEFEDRPVDFNTRDDFHTYGFEWTPTRIAWFVDGAELRTKAAGGGVPIPELSTKIMMSIWMGAFGGDPTPNQYPLFAEYDWVRFYKWDQEEFYPCTPTPGCLPDSDIDGAKNNPDDGVPYIEP
jgi:beta-glucanase (GH16 family)